jgi:hypothetical protein
MTNTRESLEATEIEIAADDPLHEEVALPFDRYGIVDHIRMLIRARICGA